MINARICGIQSALVGIIELGKYSWLFYPLSEGSEANSQPQYSSIYSASFFRSTICDTGILLLVAAAVQRFEGRFQSLSGLPSPRIR